MARRGWWGIPPIEPWAAPPKLVQALAGVVMPPVVVALSLVLLALAVLPARRPRRLAALALGVAALGFVLLACSFLVPWAADQGLGPLLRGTGLIAGGVAAHVALAAWLWRAGAAAA